ncbi:MAG: hypothetical protein KC493_16850 [Bacteriovoracaceae bacterium]|nr:hypothetical protein [Bacteriovoracaceae bacterium]
MKISIFLIFLTQLLLSSALAGSDIYFKDQKHSLTRWDTLDPDDWMNFGFWRKARRLKDQQPKWETILQEKRLREIMGRVIECKGDCRLFRGRGFNNVTFRSSVREGDELLTIGDSYAWIYLMDGTIIRVSPDSSLTFKEFNIGTKEFFVHIRVNAGNVVYMNRSRSPMKEVTDRETDQYFLPLTFYEANPVSGKTNIDEDNLFEMLDETDNYLANIKRLNGMIAKNNEKISDKKTYNFLVMPNGTMTGYDLNVEVIVLLGNKSYIKQRDSTWQGYTKQKDESGVFYFRGFENKQTFGVDIGVWQEIDVSGRSILPAPKPEKFSFGELLSKRPYSIMVAREYFMEKFSIPFFNITDPDEMALKQGYRLWGKLGSDSKDDMQRRLNYLHEYTRRIETSNLLAANQFKKKVEKRGDDTRRFEYSNRFYKTAFNYYIRRNESSSLESSDREILNSTTKKLWKRMHGIR